jgi:RHS repeat-associated protein
VLKTEGGVTTYYPNKLYNESTASTTKHIFAHNTPIATITSGTSGSAGIALHATSSTIHGGYTSGPTTKNWTHTTSGSNRLLVLFADIWQDVGGTGTITSATYNGTSLTKATSTRGGGMASEIWYLANPASGSNTVSVTVTGATDSIKLTAASFTGANQSSPLDASNATSGWGGNPTISLTTGTANDLVTATLSRFGTTDATTNRTSLYNSTASSTLGAASYQIATAAGSYSDTYTGSASSDWSMAMAGFKPATGGTGSTTMYMIHGDHLGGSNVVTDANGDVVEVADYYPYGTERIATGGFEEQRKFAGTEYDSGTGLNYMGARYYAGGKGRFLSEDPAFLELGGPSFGAKVSEQSLRGMGQLLDTSARKNPNEKLLEMYLLNPQLLNSYSYVVNNPLKYRDEDGNTPILYGAVFGAGLAVGQQAYMDIYRGEFSGARSYMDQAIIGGVSGGSTGLKILSTASRAVATFAGFYASSLSNDIYASNNTTPQLDHDKAGIQGLVGVGTLAFTSLIPATLGATPQLSTLINAIKEFSPAKTVGYFTNAHAKESFVTQLAGTLTSIAAELKGIQSKLEKSK